MNTRCDLVMGVTSELHRCAVMYSDVLPNIDAVKSGVTGEVVHFIKQIELVVLFPP
jgi:hypothetical protein